MKRPYKQSLLIAACILTGIGGFYARAGALQFRDDGYVEYGDEQLSGWEGASYPEHTPAEQARLDAYEELLDDLYERNEILYHLYRFFNPFFLDHVMSNIFTFICAVVSLVAFFMLGHTAEERKMLFVFLLLGIFCWLRLIMMAVGMVATGRSVF